jgi:Xaa-Pro aminopeptidase
MNYETTDVNCTLPEISRSEYLRRIDRFMLNLMPSSVAIFVSNPLRKFSRDVDYVYRPSTNILYLNGFQEPECALILCNLPGAPKLSMFVQERDVEKETWTGYRLGPEGAIEHHMADVAFTNDKFEVQLEKLLKQARHVYYHDHVNPQWDDRFEQIWMHTRTTKWDPYPIMNEMRLFKSAEELAMMRHAGKITRDAHHAAMRTCQAGKLEYNLQAAIKFEFFDQGCFHSAYPEIVAGGDNACILHYGTNNKVLRDGDLVLIDAGCWFSGYSADITRTFPVNGVFSPEQKALYQVVLDAQAAGIEAARVGTKFHDVYMASQNVLRAGLVQLGILSTACSTRRSEVAAYRKAKREGCAGEFLLLEDVSVHYIGHWLGMDVHDVGDQKKQAGRKRIIHPCDLEGLDMRLRPVRSTRLLEEGMCMTVEPGLYFKRGDKRLPEWCWGIGIRIEDDIVVTADGAQLLNPEIARTVEDIENLMRKDMQ